VPTSHITEFLTVNIAVESLGTSIPLFERMGLVPIAPAHFPDPPIQMTDVTLPVPGGAAFSLIEACEGQGPVGRFTSRRGPGLYSVAVRVDDLAATMRDWAAEGLEWVSREPVPVPGGRAARYVADEVTVNWVTPKSLGGVLLEAFEITGNVRDF
jgi:4-hydroxyphenylpyruvate dioxygenase-like putative hemolysin